MKNGIGVIFDFDGTLIDSLDYALESFNFALDQLGQSARTPEAIKKYFGSAADKIFFNILKNEIQAQQAFELFLEHQKEIASKMKTHEGIIDLLEKFKSEDVALGVVTGRHRRDLELLLSHHRLSGYFKTLIADSDVQKSKPDPEGLQLAAKKMGFPTENVFYIGDSVMDVQAANRAGSISVAALWDSLAKPSELSAQKPKYLAHHPLEIFEVYKAEIRELKK